jgi:hypothetical protein
MLDDKRMALSDTSKIEFVRGFKVGWSGVTSQVVIKF